MESSVEIPEVIETTAVSLFSNDPVQALEQAQTLVQKVSSLCIGPKFISNIQGKDFPKVEWWTTVGAALGLFPVTIWSKRVDRDGMYFYEARVEVRRNGNIITAAEAMCSSDEKRWKTAEEYAVRSMAITRATAKAYRIGLSFLATLAGLEPTPAEEIPPGGFGKAKKESPQKGTTVINHTPEGKELARRIHEYLCADNNGDEKRAQDELEMLTIEHGLLKSRYFRRVPDADIKKLWTIMQSKVEAYEKAGGGNAK